MFDRICAAVSNALGIDGFPPPGTTTYRADPTRGPPPVAAQSGAGVSAIDLAPPPTTKATASEQPARTESRVAAPQTTAVPAALMQAANTSDVNAALHHLSDTQLRQLLVELEVAQAFNNVCHRVGKEHAVYNAEWSHIMEGMFDRARSCKRVADFLAHSPLFAAVRTEANIRNLGAVITTPSMLGTLEQLAAARFPIHGMFGGGGPDETTLRGSLASLGVNLLFERCADAASLRIQVDAYCRDLGHSAG